METPQWLFGPSGDLRPLPPPEPGIGNGVERFGGIHQAINGARTVDTFGFRAGYEFAMEYLEPDEYFRLESLFTETIPGPFWLIDPMRKNLLSRESAVSRDENYSGHGLTWQDGNIVEWVTIQDSPVSWNRRAAKWSNLSSGGYINFDAEHKLPVKAGTPVTFSMHLKPSVGITLRLSVTTFSNDTMIETIYGPIETLTAGVWTRLLNPFTLTDDVEEIGVSLVASNPGPADAETVHIVSPQVEFGSEATDPALGGAAVVAAIESLKGTSPRYPYQSATLKLLEV